MKLYTNHLKTSPYVLSVLVALEEKGIAYTTHSVNLTQGEQHLPAHTSISINHKVPVLADGNFVLSESSAITEYLDEQYPQGPALYPQDTKQRAIARQIQAWIRSDFHALKKERSTDTFFYGTANTPLSEKARQDASKLISAADRYLSSAKKHIAEEWSLADIDLAVMLKRLTLNGDHVPQHLTLYADMQWKRPSVQQWLNMNRPML